MENQKSEFINAGFFRDLALVSLAFSVVALAPFLGAFVFVFVPLPALYYYAKQGRVRGLLTLVLSLLVVFASLKIINADGSLPLIASLALAGVAIAEFLKRNYSIEKTVCCSVLTIFTAAALLLLYTGFQMGETPWNLLASYLDKKIRYSLNFYATLNIASEQVNLIKDNIPEIVALITRIFPALFLVILTFVVWANLLAGRSIFRKYGLPFPDFGDLSNWKAPEKMVWYLIAAGVMLLLPEEGIEFMGWNMLIILLFVYLLTGVAIVSFFLKKSALPMGFRYLIYFLIFAQQIITMLIVAAGIFDLWADFRKLNKTMEDSAT